MHDNTQLENCPHCNANLNDGDIFEVLREQNPDESDEKIREWSGYYGWTKENPKHFGRQIAIYDMDRDRTSHFVCPDCQGRIER